MSPAGLYRVATNLGYNALRGEKRRVRREEAATGRVSLTAPGADAEMERRERERQVTPDVGPHGSTTGQVAGPAVPGFFPIANWQKFWAWRLVPSGPA